MRPASERDLIPLGPIAWCWSLGEEKKRGEGREKEEVEEEEEGGLEEEEKKMREMAIRPENVPLSPPPPAK